jgi:hypothetical protein
MPSPGRVRSAEESSLTALPTCLPSPAKSLRSGPGWIQLMVGRWLLLLGFVCLAVMVLTHIAEWLRVFPSMGWGLRSSPGHYLDFISAVLGCALLIVGMIWFSFNT